MKLEKITELLSDSDCLENIEVVSELSREDFKTLEACYWLGRDIFPTSQMDAKKQFFELLEHSEKMAHNPLDNRDFRYLGYKTNLLKCAKRGISHLDGTATYYEEE